MSTAKQLMSSFKDPIKEIETIRNGIMPDLVENFLIQESLAVNDVLARLQIPKSTYFAKKKAHKLLDSMTTEKFIRLISIIQIATEVLGREEVKNWLYKKVASLGNGTPLDLLDTEAGHRLVEQALLQIKYGIYN